jgi:hypothetical protein
VLLELYSCLIFSSSPPIAVFDFMAVIKTGSSIGSAVIGGAGGGGGGVVTSGMLSCREVLQLDDDVFPPSDCWIALLLATTADMLLDRTASVTVFTRFPEDQ